MRTIIAIVVLVFIATLILSGDDEPETAVPTDAAPVAEEEAARENEEFERLMRQIALIESDPCATELYFVDAFRWMITCEGCAAMPASGIYPNAIIEDIERWAVGGRITVTELLAINGQC